MSTSMQGQSVRMIAIVFLACAAVMTMAGEPGATTQPAPAGGTPSSGQAPGTRPSLPAAEDANYTVLFDGKTFDGWEGDRTVFRIEDGAIVGGILKEKVKQNEFLSATKEYGDFELRLKFKLLGKGANGGIQIRSRRIPNNNEMIGYQADLGESYWGCLYDESRRRKVLAAPDKTELDKVLKREDWNQYVIRCEGRRIQLWINGYRTVDYTESDEKIEQKGLIGLQIHGGPPCEAWYKDIAVKELPAPGSK